MTYPVADAGPQTPKIEQAALIISGNMLTPLSYHISIPVISEIPYISSLNL